MVFVPFLIAEQRDAKITHRYNQCDMNLWGLFPF